MSLETVGWIFLIIAGICAIIMIWLWATDDGDPEDNTEEYMPW